MIDAHIKDHDEFLQWLILGGFIQITDYVGTGEKVLLALLFICGCKCRALITGRLKASQ